MERQIRERKHTAIPGALFDATITAGEKDLETYQILVKEVNEREVLIEEVYVPQRRLIVPRKQFESGRIGIMKFNPILDQDMV